MSVRYGSLALACLAFAATAGTARASASAPTVVVRDAEGGAVITATLESAEQAVTRESVFDVGVRLEMAEGWHVYWTNPGDTGVATRVTFSSTQAELGALAWPAPERFDSAGGLVSFGYARAVELVAPAEVLSVDEGAREVVIEARVSLLACHEVCIPGKATLTLAVPLVDDTRRAARGGPPPAADLVVAARLREAKARVPRAPSCSVRAQALSSSVTLSLAGCAPLRAPHFIPALSSDALRVTSSSRNALTLAVADPARPPSRVVGVLYLDDGAFSIDVPISSPAATSP